MPRKKSTQEPKHDELLELQSTSEKGENKNTEPFPDLEVETTSDAKQISGGVPNSEALENAFAEQFSIQEDNETDAAIQNMVKGSKWLSAFLESYRPPLDGEHYLTDKEVAEMLRVSRRTLQEYRNNRMLPFILLAGKVLYPESGLRELLEANYLKPLE